MKIRPVVLSGGSGTRLWPVSRRDYPKQFAELLGRQSLLASALELFSDSDLFAPPLIVANESHKFFVLDAVAPYQNKPTIILEPCGRNTAPAALTAALAEEEGALHLLAPSDHVVQKPEAFFAAVQNAIAAASEGRIALFGVKPEYVETGYGYIQSGGATPWKGVEKIACFKEKPDAATAEALISAGALWNSGVFLYDPKIVVEEIQRLAPEQVALCKTALRNSATDLGCRVLDQKSYEKLQNISFDCLVMENAANGVVMPCDMGWSDVGSWQALWRLQDKDERGNVKQGAVTVIDAEGCYLRSDGPVIGAIGVEDLAVIAAKDAVLIAPRQRAQDVRRLVDALALRNSDVATEHKRVMRPWGTHEGVAQGERFQVKHIVVKPGQALSLQMHRHRAEHWIVVAGTALAECDGAARTIYENESTFIPKGAVHRLSNPGKVDLHLVEVQSGEYLGEDDVVRFADLYGRVA